MMYFRCFENTQSSFTGNCYQIYFQALKTSDRANVIFGEGLVLEKVFEERIVFADVIEFQNASLSIE